MNKIEQREHHGAGEFIFHQTTNNKLRKIIQTHLPFQLANNEQKKLKALSILISPVLITT